MSEVATFQTIVSLINACTCTIKRHTPISMPFLLSYAIQLSQTNSFDKKQTSTSTFFHMNAKEMFGIIIFSRTCFTIMMN